LQLFVAEDSGFCFGVRRTLHIAESAAKKHGLVYSLGPLIHNPQEVQRLKKKILFL